MNLSNIEQAQRLHRRKIDYLRRLRQEERALAKEVARLKADRAALTAELNRDLGPLGLTYDSGADTLKVCVPDDDSG